MLRRSERLLTLLLFTLFPACDSQGDQLLGGSPANSSLAEPWFEEQASALGLDFEHTNGATGFKLFPETIGGGIGVLDFDKDGWLDIFCVQSGSLDPENPDPRSHGLFRNRGDGSFEDVTAGSGVQAGGFGIGVATGDFDMDGLTDIYVLNVGANVLLRNLGGGKFEDATQTAGVAGNVWSASACFSDYDQDGDLDLYVTNYVSWTLESDRECYLDSGARSYCGPQSYNAPLPDNLYRNEGDGTFVDVSSELGLDVKFGNGLGVVSSDFDGDGRLDFFVANDLSEDQLWIAQQDGTFEDEAYTAGCAVDGNGSVRAGMGVDTADVDNDGDQDLIVVHLHGEMDAYYRNEGHYFFEETTSVGIGLATRPFTRFGVGFVDFDNDGDLDIYEANGRVGLVGESTVADPFAEPNTLLIRTSEGKWKPAQLAGGTRLPKIHNSRGVAFGDFDNDGGMDAVVMNINSTPYLLHNRKADRGNWLMFEVQNESGSSAIGARISIELNGVNLRRDVQPGRGFASSSDVRVHFGLGQAEGIAKAVVQWVDGTRESFGPLTCNQVVRVRKGEGSREPRQPARTE